MLDDKLDAIINKYGIFDEEGIHTEPKEESGWRVLVHLIIGVLYLSVVLNRTLDEVKDRNIALCAPEGRLRKAIWWLLLPRNRKKICFLVSLNGDSFFNKKTIEYWEMDEYHIETVLTIDWDLGGYANLVGSCFKGKIIDMCSLIYQNKLERFFSTKLEQNPYLDIFIAKKNRERSETVEEKRKWSKCLIAYYVRARDFLSLEEEIRRYVAEGHDIENKYSCFWGEVNSLLVEIKKTLSQRNCRDILIHWIDQMEKEDFFSMEWIGNSKQGVIFHNAYTVMTNTTAIARSIFTGDNVKAGKLQSIGKIGEDNSILIRENKDEFNIVFFTRYNLRKYIDSKYVYNYGKNLSTYMPSMIGFWEALDMLMTCSKPCIFFLHSLETHDPYCSGDCDVWHLCSSSRGNFQHERDYATTAKCSRDYLDRQLRWFSSFYPSNLVAIYMSDHGHEMNLSERNINMPFKIIGLEENRHEYRFFSYKNLYKLIHAIYRSDGMIDDCFSEHVIIDAIDPYNRDRFKSIIAEKWEHFILTRGKQEHNELKKYLQTTKVITCQEEYYTINILGEETYYRDKKCMVNLINNPSYAKRIAELRKEAGKFNNPWKEEQKVAIDFYEYLGIQESDIIAQCY